MKQYRFKLLNTDESLDLTTKCNEIEDAIAYINAGKRRENPVFVDVDIKFDRKSVERTSFVVGADLGAEADTDAFRQKIAWFLVNKRNMRNYCDETGHMLSAPEIE